MKYRTIVADPPWPYTDGPTPRQRERGDRSFLPYSTLPLGQIAAILRGVDAAIDAHLWLWTTQRFLWDAPNVARAAGYRVCHTLVWCKDSNGGGMGGAFPADVEFLLFCRRDWGAALSAARDAVGLTNGEIHRAVRGERPLTGLVGFWMQGDRYPNESDWESLGRVLGDFGPRAGLPRLARASWWQWPRGKHSAKPDHAIDLVEQVSPGPYLELFSRRHRLGWDVWGDQVNSTVEIAAG